MATRQARRLDKLSLDGDAVRRPEDWGQLLLALRQNVQVYKVRIVSKGHKEWSAAHRSTIQSRADAEKQKKVSKALPALLANEKIPKYLASSVKGCLVVNPVLTELELAGIPFTLSALQTLAQGLLHGRTLQQLSLARCGIGDKGLFAIATSLKSLPALTSLNFGDCSLTCWGAAVLRNLLNSKAVRRQAAIWECTLRGGPSKRDHRPRVRTTSANDGGVSDPTPAFASGLPSPIKRLTLCHNQLGDNGVHYLMEALVEEIGLEALDLQFNGISGIGAGIVQQVLHLNKELKIVDLGSNDVENDTLDTLFRFLQSNGGPSPDYLARSPLDPSGKLSLQYLDPLDPLRNTYIAPKSRITPKPRPRGTKSGDVGSKGAHSGNSNSLRERPPFKVGPAAVTKYERHLNDAKRPSNRKSESLAHPRSAAPTTSPHSGRNAPLHTLQVDLEADQPNLLRQNAMLRRRLKDLERVILERKNDDAGDAHVRDLRSGKETPVEEGYQDFGRASVATVLDEDRRPRVEPRKKTMNQPSITEPVVSPPEARRQAHRIPVQTDTTPLPPCEPKKPTRSKSPLPTSNPQPHSHSAPTRSSKAPRPTTPPTPNPSHLQNAHLQNSTLQSQLATLVDIMQSSLQGFHTLLDRIEDREERRRERERRRHRKRKGSRRRDGGGGVESVGSEGRVRSGWDGGDSSEEGG
ncbi:uncharacterized protein EV422DRAFT_594297 [Fimicolochytrium jonesii]|uniref:uncharacterized protein n=1 Tax=Fimicolochytrium jonesii TaxID=1396493 RepID=UPI0022FE2135|nr:uncharacterized protein EV422DRAFT_594297 [Fimicolochytrium jonesii]KAI8827207.1 hypothetical protein EV422DRAFT_594297 [Fimicolochytrium jonesii]